MKNFKQFINEGLIYRPELEIYDEYFDGMFTFVKFKDKITGKNLGNSHLAYREKKYKDINAGDEVLELHIQVDEKLQRQGYAIKMIKSFLALHGGVGYIPHCRITNPIMYNLLDKLSKEFNVDHYDDYYLIYE
jgi:GNAT superfamily N-acetyltransferase